MRLERADGRRLRFELQMDERESIPGVIARGVHGHVLLRTRPVLDAAGVALKHAGHSQLATPAQLERLGHVIRCPLWPMLAVAGERLVAADAPAGNHIRFGDLVLPRGQLELDRRRISPSSLARRDFHRLDWLNRLLPYCPESLERLTSACSNCLAELGWHYARGLGICEHCGREVPTSTEAALPDRLADDYRLFARLSSPSPRDVADAIDRLPTILHQHAPRTLVRLALHVGGLVQDDPVTAASLPAILDLPKPVLAEIAAAGTALLRTWPAGLQRWATECFDELHPDPAALRLLRSRLQRITARDREATGPSRIVADALPGLRQHAVHGFSMDSRYYLYKEVQRRLALDNGQMDALRRRNGIGYRRTTSSAHRRGRFDADRIDALLPAFRGSLPFNACTGRLKLPYYAIEQCCRPGLLQWQSDPTFLAIKSRSGIDGTSLTTLRERLIDARCRTGRPSSTVSLSIASKRIGGRPKPWGSIVEALLTGHLRFWLVDDLPTSKSIHVLASDLVGFDDVVDDASPYIGEVSGIVSQADAAEMLNIKPLLLPKIGHEFGLRFAPVGRTLATSRAAVLDAAERVAWNTEIAVRLGISFRDVEAILTPLGVGRIAGGWCRPHLIAEGILLALRSNAS